MLVALRSDAVGNHTAASANPFASSAVPTLLCSLTVACCLLVCTSATLTSAAPHSGSPQLLVQGPSEP